MVRSIKSRGTTTCNFAYSGLLTEAVLLGNVAYRVGKEISWRADKGTTGNKNVDELLGREYRKGWELPGFLNTDGTGNNESRTSPQPRTATTR
jgi:hypothetical protein